MTDSDVQSAYSARADEYVSVLGSIEAMHEPDRQLIFRWASQLSGRIVDAGCGPGHWTDFLSKLGSDVEGVDLVPAFIDQAQARFPNVPFRVAPFDGLDLPAGRVAGILAWYSVIHLDPGRVPVVLEEFAHSLEPDGSLLLGFFEGARLEQFPHAVTAAYFWPGRGDDSAPRECGVRGGGNPHARGSEQAATRRDHGSTSRGRCRLNSRSVGDRHTEGPKPAALSVCAPIIGA